VLQTVPPTVPLDKDLEALHEFLTHQGVPRGPHHREWIGVNAVLGLPCLCHPLL
jgi:hypothetical protein